MRTKIIWNVTLFFGIILVWSTKVECNCSGNGRMNDVTGICECNKGFYGTDCDCDIRTEIAEALCRRYPSDKSVCSGRGECECGACHCFLTRPGSTQRYTGQYCECNDYSCPYSNNVMCGGNGVCRCGQCECDEGYSGEACDLVKNNDTCISPYSGLLCNGVGECISGICQCYTELYYRGITCDECPTCPGHCTRNKDCVMCLLGESSRYKSKSCSDACEITNVMIVNELETMEEGEHLCQYMGDTTDSLIKFTYKENMEDRTFDVKVLKSSESSTDAVENDNLRSEDKTSTSHTIHSSLYLILLLVITSSRYILY